MNSNNHYFLGLRSGKNNFSKDFSIRRLKDIELQKQSINELNSYMFRSDEFNKEDTSSNFLFAGCSNTFGYGLPNSFTWAYQLNKMLDGKKLFNLGIPGASAAEIVYNVFNYIDIFGKPKGVFILFPEFFRTVSYSQNSLCTKFIKSDNDTDEYKESCLEYFLFIRQLEIFLNFIDIPFVWGTWCPDAEKVLNQNNHLFSNFYSVLDNLDWENEPKEKSPYWKKSSDEIHFSGKNNFAIARSFKKKWETLQ